MFNGECGLIKREIFHLGLDSRQENILLNNLSQDIVYSVITCLAMSWLRIIKVALGTTLQAPSLLQQMTKGVGTDHPSHTLISHTPCLSPSAVSATCSITDSHSCCLNLVIFSTTVSSCTKLINLSHHLCSTHS